ncbi:MBL fold metallo-hydrolase [Carboxylicivirga caseinilyticus]|uniref:MBL fold metallo-hydrolase n=1 Tax=Carboxylicivirga caseinilyticus TaxID=3417572 RepID=UPI003D3492B0|nr:MBL fold metallo-hydrolase [Marinilabiliaceae bacterium A049]
MKNILTPLILLLSLNMISAQDEIKTQNGSFTIYFVGHGTLYIEYNETIIHIDPWSKLSDYSQLPDADFILITHQHRDHLDAGAIREIIKENTQIFAPSVCKEGLEEFTQVAFLKNNDKLQTTFGELMAVPAYNIVHIRDNNMPYHPKGEGNGYVLNIDGKKVYVAGDTENIPEMNELKNIDIAFLPMNLPYTMTPEMVSKAVEMIKPVILYPYHYGETDTDILVNLLKDSSTEVRIRNMK